MTYLVDDKDIHFNLFDWLKIDERLNFAAFQSFSKDVREMILSEALKFAQNELAPLNKSADQEGCRIEKGQVFTPRGFKEAYQKFAQNGFIAPDINPQFGGQGLSYTLSAVLSEYFCGANVPFAMYAGLTRGAANLIETFASDKLKNIFCEKMYTGVWGGTMCLTEPQAGSAVGDLTTSAKKYTDDTYQIKGNKIFISCGDHDLTENIIHLVLARVEGDPKGTKGLSLFIVPKIWVHEDGKFGDKNDVSCINIEEKMGIHASSTCSLNFGENGKCLGYLVGKQSEGIKYMFQMMNEARLLCGLQGVSVAGTAFENALAYAKERVQGQGKKIIEYPDVRRNLSLCKALVEGSRVLIHYTAMQIDMAKHLTDNKIKQRTQNRADLLTPICKAYCSDWAFRVTEIAMQVLGGYGYIAEYPIEQYMRDVKISSLYEGTNGIQALDLLGRKLPFNNGQLFQEFYEDLSEFIDQNHQNPELKTDISEFKKALDTVGQVAMQLAQWGLSGDKIKPQLGATPFLEICGHVVIAYLLLDRALVAQKKLKTGINDSFYRDKIRVAQFFVRHLLPRTRMHAKSILTGDQTAMEFEF